MSATTRLSQPCWSTSAFGDSMASAAVEWAALREHLELCRDPRKWLGALRYVAERTRGFVAARFITTLMLAVLVNGLTWGLWL